MQVVLRKQPWMRLRNGLDLLKEKCGQPARKPAARQIKKAKKGELSQLRGLKNRKVDNGQGNVVIGHKHYLQYSRIKPDVGLFAEEGFLEKIFLRLAPVSLLFFIGLLYLLNEIAFAITAQPWFRYVFAKVRGDVIPVHLKTCINKKPRKTTTNNGNDE